MRVKVLRNGRIEEHDAGYATRMIEQGQAVPAPAKPAPKPGRRDTMPKAESEGGPPEEK